MSLDQLKSVLELLKRRIVKFVLVPSPTDYNYLVGMLNSCQPYSWHGNNFDFSS